MKKSKSFSTKNDIEKLNFPVIRVPLPPSKHLSMTDYVKWVQYYWNHIADRKAVRRARKKEVLKGLRFRLA